MRDTEREKQKEKERKIDKVLIKGRRSVKKSTPVHIVASIFENYL